MNNELIDALEALLAATPDADSLRVLVGQATANKGPMSAEEFIAFAQELLDAARKADETA
jgi:major membrane immunogen (membrane-anchored lipoprotein)